MLKRLIGSLRRRREFRDSGAVLVELAITAPMLVTLVLGVADYGILMSSADSLTAATRAGAEVVKADPNVTATQLTALGIFPSGATATVSARICTCVDDTSVTCPVLGEVNPCAAKTDPRLLIYESVSATESFSPLFTWANFAFPSSLNATATVRLQ